MHYSIDFTFNPNANPPNGGRLGRMSIILPVLTAGNYTANPGSCLHKANPIESLTDSPSYYL